MANKPKHDIGYTVNGWTIVAHGSRCSSFIWQHTCGNRMVAGDRFISKLNTCSKCNAEGNRANSTNICFDCDNSCGNCSWSSDFTPVEGWTAEKIIRRVFGYKGGYKGYIESEGYHITACPQFKRTKKKGKCK